MGKRGGKISPSTEFKPGQSGNPNGRPKKIPALDVLLADVLGEEKDGQIAATAILKALRLKATKGDVRAAEVLLDRAYGKPKQPLEATGANGAALFPEMNDRALTDRIAQIEGHLGAKMGKKAK